MKRKPCQPLSPYPSPLILPYLILPITLAKHVAAVNSLATPLYFNIVIFAGNAGREKDANIVDEEAHCVRTTCYRRHISNNKDHQNEIYRSLTKNDIVKIISNLEDSNTGTKQLTQSLGRCRQGSSANSYMTMTTLRSSSSRL